MFAKQFSIFDEVPDIEKRIFLDIFAASFYDKNRKKYRLSTIQWHDTPTNMNVGCLSRILEKYPEGTIFRLDARLVKNKKGYKYMVALRRASVQPAIEFYVFNRKLQEK